MRERLDLGEEDSGEPLALSFLVGGNDRSKHHTSATYDWDFGVSDLTH